MLRKLLDSKAINPSDAILAVCAEDTEAQLFQSLGFSNVTLANIAFYGEIGANDPFPKVVQDTMNLKFPDRSFDICFVSDGLHHCSSPHRALLEMYRVARKAVIVFESRDSLMMRLANKLNLSPKYEIEPVFEHRGGGVDNTEIPNFVYRWTEREFQKTIQSYDPTGSHRFLFFYGLNLPYQTAEMSKNSFRRYLLPVIEPAVKLVSLFAKRQCNSFAMIVMRPKTPDELWPWLKLDDNAAVVFNRPYATARYKDRPSS